MNELLFFPKIDVLIRINYGTDTNSIRYATHRAVLANEREVIENYILRKVAPNTDYFNRTPSIMLYAGIEKRLEKNLNVFRIQNLMRNALDHKIVIDNKVREFINQSLGSYYFDKVGDKLLELKNLLKNGFTEEQFEIKLMQLKILLNAYNENTGQNIHIRNILPKEILTLYCQLTNEQEVSIL